MIIVAAAVTLPLGITVSKEYAELEWPIDIAITLVWVVFAINFFGTLLVRRERHIYVAIWFYMATVITVALLHIVNSLDAADVLLTRSELKGISELVRLSRISRRTILQNLSLSLGYNTLIIPLAMMGWINPLLAAAAMAGSSVSVVLNSLRQKRQFPA